MRAGDLMRSGDPDVWATEFVRVNAERVVSAEEDRDLDLADEDDYLTERDVATWLELALEAGRRQGRTFRSPQRDVPGAAVPYPTPREINAGVDLHRYVPRPPDKPTRVQFVLEPGPEQRLPPGTYSVRVTNVSVEHHPVDTGLGFPHFPHELLGTTECRIEGVVYPGK